MRYSVQWNYSSGLAGPWLVGDSVELSEEQASAVNRDSPGVLVPVGEQLQLDSHAERLVETPANDRQVKGSKKRGDRGREEPITKDDFKAVKGGDA